MDNDEIIVINKNELNTEYVKERIKEERESKKDLNKSERIPIKNNILLNPIFYTAASGLIAAIISWACLEPFVITSNKLENKFILELMLITFITLVSATISLIDSLMSGNFIKTLKIGGIGLALSLFSSIIIVYLANGIFTWLQIINKLFLKFLNLKLDILRSYQLHVLILIISRSPAWTFLGAGVGIIPGIANYSKKLFFNGLIGGMLGGFIGGFIFDPISILATKIFTGAGAAPSRCIGFGILGLMIGVFIGIVENMAKDVWITMKSGPLRGKQFVIYHNPTIIGSSPRSDIYIFKDASVMPIHAKIQKRGTKYEIIDESKNHSIYINSEKINESKILEPNDNIILGQSILEFHQKERS